MLYLNKIPEKEAAQEYFEHVQRQVPLNRLRFKKSYGFERGRYYHSEWRQVSQHFIDTFE